MPDRVTENPSVLVVVLPTVSCQAAKQVAVACLPMLEPGRLSNAQTLTSLTIDPQFGVVMILQFIHQSTWLPVEDKNGFHTRCVFCCLRIWLTSYLTMDDGE